MGTIVIHAGRPKTGSTAIQRWLADVDRGGLLEGVTVAAPVRVEPTRRSHGWAFDHVDSPNLNASQIVYGYLGFDRPEGMVRDLVEDLAGLADRHGCVVVSGEALARLVEVPDPALFGALRDVASPHRVRILYYVRPQADAIEAEWGEALLDIDQPASFVRRRSANLFYHRTLQAGQHWGSNVEFVVRPYHLALLERADVVCDFARHGLGATVAPERRFAGINPGLPLTLVNAARRVLSEEGPASVSLDAKGRLRDHTARRWSPQVETAAEEGRQLLRRWADATFHADNDLLLAELEWNVDGFVTQDGSVAAGPTTTVEVDTLNDLWTPELDERTRAELARALGLRRPRRLLGWTRRAPR
jgi:hypothetical protein